MNRQLKNLFLELTPDYQGDKWGYMANTAFDIQEALYLRQGVCDETFKPSPFLTDLDCEDEYKIKLLTETNLELLEQVGRFTMRLWHMLEKAGLSY